MHYERYEYIYHIYTPSYLHFEMFYLHLRSLITALYQRRVQDSRTFGCFVRGQLPCAGE
jgi:hypothetical protein